MRRGAPEPVVIEYTAPCELCGADCVWRTVNPDDAHSPLAPFTTMCRKCGNGLSMWTVPPSPSAPRVVVELARVARRTIGAA